MRSWAFCFDVQTASEALQVLYNGKTGRRTSFCVFQLGGNEASMTRLKEDLKDSKDRKATLLHIIPVNMYVYTPSFRNIRTFIGNNTYSRSEVSGQLLY